MDRNTLLQYLQYPGLIGVDAPSVVTVLRDMTGPIDMNNGQSIAAVELEYDTKQTCELAKAILAKMKSKGHDAFAFYKFKEIDERKFILYGTLTIQAKPSTP